MRKLTLTAATPAGRFFQGEILGLTLRGTEGDLTVLPGHAPLITTFSSGLCRLRLPDGIRRLQTAAGLLTVSDAEITLLSASLRWE